MRPMPGVPGVPRRAESQQMILAVCTSTRMNPAFKEGNVPYAWGNAMFEHEFAAFKKAAEKRWPEVTVTMEAYRECR